MAFLFNSEHSKAWIKNLYSANCDYFFLGYLNFGFVKDSFINRDYKNHRELVNPGSAILIVILIMSVLSICCVTFLQNSYLFYDISLRRLEYEQKYRAASCALDYAAYICSNNFDQIVDNIVDNKIDNKVDNKDLDISNKSSIQETLELNKPQILDKLKVVQNYFEIETVDFELSKNLKYACKIYIKKDGPKALSLKSILFGASGEKTFEISCKLFREEKSEISGGIRLLDQAIKDKKINNFIIKNWKICE